MLYRGSVMSKVYYPFRPNLQGLFMERFLTKAKELTADKRIITDEFALQEYSWATNNIQLNTSQRKVYRTVWLLLRDLIRLGWDYRWYDGNFELCQPNLQHKASSKTEQDVVKAIVRNSMEGPRLQKILESKDFIEKMELNTEGRKPITSLIADGKELARDLEDVQKLDNKALKVKALKEIIDPYLQLVTDNSVCENTGQKLNDIWRYFRYTWSSPYEQTPGRSLHYLIRDRSRENHPVMGIASLENGPMMIKDRDNYIGWTVEKFIEKSKNHNDIKHNKKMANILLEYLKQGIDSINLTGLCKYEECKDPSEYLIQKLFRIAGTSKLEKDKALKDWSNRDKNNEEFKIEKSELGNISQGYEDALYMGKRAKNLAELLQAKRIMLNQLELIEDVDNWSKFIKSDKGHSVIRSAISVQKNKHIGSSIMELNVCGAVPPYNEVLSGKLTALAMISPQVINDYKEKYGNRSSDIASRLKGEPVIRPADLVYIGTTSLYRVGSSQYNRLKLPEGLLKDGTNELKWKHIGETKGYGSLHISRLTLQCLEEVVEDKGVVQRVFGGGSSPRFRSIKKGLETVFQGQSNIVNMITNHSMPRLIYGAWLAGNGSEYLMGMDKKPSYYFNVEENYIKQTEKIIDYWRERWLIKRIDHKEALNRLASFNPKNILLSRELKAVKDNYQEIEVPNMPNYEASTHEFIRKLYRGSSAYADRIEFDLLEKIHVPTSLDEEIITNIKQKKSVILTGNPGDGKTHLLRILGSKLKEVNSEALIEYDASSITDEELFDKWNKAYKHGIPFCVAINEAVLINLYNKYPDFPPLRDSVHQVVNAVRYNSEYDHEHDCIAYDLSRRNVLSKNVINAVLDKLTDLNLTDFDNYKGTDLDRNIRMLSNSQFRQRLQFILDRVARRGFHATLREVQSFVAYLLFAGRDYETMLETSGDDEYALHQLPFKGEGRLFNAIRSVFDPAKVSHPKWDDKLVYGELDSNAEWINGSVAGLGAIPPTDESKFFARKRAFYFFHKNGLELLDLSGDDESSFEKFLYMRDRQAMRLIINRINKFFGEQASGDEIKVWQTHRYNQSPRRILFSASSIKRAEFELVHPTLIRTMGEAFDYAKDHVVLRLRRNKEAKLRIDYSVFELLAKAERGIPVLSLEGDISRRMWQFMEKLIKPLDAEEDPEVTFTILDTSTGERISVSSDLELKQFLEIDSHD